MADFFKARVGSQIVDVVTAVGKPAELAFDVAEVCVADDDAFEAAVDDGTGVGQGKNLRKLLGTSEFEP